MRSVTSLRSLKTYEAKILGAEDRIAQLEHGVIYRFGAMGYSVSFRWFKKHAQAVAQIDVLHGFAVLALTKSLLQTANQILVEFFGH